MKSKHHHNLLILLLAISVLLPALAGSAPPPHDRDRRGPGRKPGFPEPRRHGPPFDRRPSSPAPPRFGLIVGDLPGTHVMVRVGKFSFYYRSGVFYRKEPAGYVIVAPPPGVVVEGLPPGYVILNYAGSLFYYYNGVFYTANPPRTRFTVVAPPLGIMIDVLPQGYTLVTANGLTYYVVGGVHYLPVQSGARIHYQVTNPPAPAPVVVTQPTASAVPSGPPSPPTSLPPGFQQTGGQVNYQLQEGYWAWNGTEWKRIAPHWVSVEVLPEETATAPEVAGAAK